MVSSYWRSIPQNHVWRPFTVFSLICLLKLGSPVTSICVVHVPRAVSTCWAGSWGHQENMPTPGAHEWKVMVHLLWLISGPQRSVIQIWPPRWGCWELVEALRGEGAWWDVLRPLGTHPGRGCGTLVSTRFLHFFVSQPCGERHCSVPCTHHAVLSHHWASCLWLEPPKQDPGWAFSC